MTDRCAVNSATIRAVEDNWQTNIQQLNCNLHPLETITKECKKVLKQHEKENKFPARQCYGTDCFAGNLVLKSNQLRYKDSTGDPRLFKSRLQSANLPSNLLPRFRVARMHITHQISRVLLEHEEFFTKLFADKQLKSSQLRSAVHLDFARKEVKVELQVLRVIGKAITGPWMKYFYDDETSELHHFDAFELVKKSIGNIQQWADDPLSVFSGTVDCFGDEMTMGDCLGTLPDNKILFTSMLSDCFKRTVTVLNRQYSNYFSLNIDDKLKEETRSAKVHNIYAEQIMGMFSAMKALKTNATVDYISCAIRARKNHAVNYLMNMNEEDREELMTKARQFARKDRVFKRKTQKALEDEIRRRYEVKVQKGVDADHRKLVNQLKKGKRTTADFPEQKEMKKIYTVHIHCSSHE
ncbi:uncharacterized protein LOC117100647 [Anneissia japonica]|uniref:uncharacterized protein LOC117100647 n=1 Tax=Anneissia japonica TaxID=1529436 RepID=UPI0014255DD4|nr:uncharacterized protein LOC117100647 [Anneissia japonica]